MRLFRLSGAGSRCAGARQMHTALLEVERKFNVAAAHRLRSLLNVTSDDDIQLRMRPKLKTGALEFTRQTDLHINDQYFVTPDGRLDASNIWIRRRTINAKDIKWEAKIRLGGDYLNSEFEEITGKSKIDEYLKMLGICNLQRIVNLNTARQSWVVSGEQQNAEMVVVVDLCTAGGMGKSDSAFRHIVGEVGMTRDIGLEQEDGEETKRAKKELTGQMSSDLKGFMQRHEDLFPTKPGPVGKLTAYFAWQKQLKDGPQSER